MEAIAAEAHVARTTIYRRWPNKATVVMDAFLAEVGPGIAFPELPSALESLRMQMKLLARAFRGRPGLLIRSLLAEAQFDPELKRAFRDRWIMKRRAAAQVVIKAGILAGELPAATDPDVLLDALYGGLYYRLLMGTGSLSDAYVEAIWRTVLRSSMVKGELREPMGSAKQ
jgi:AcrR family transcriptional regulator